MHEVLLRLPELGLWVGDTQVSWGYMAGTLQAWLEQGRRKARPHLIRSWEQSKGATHGALAQTLKLGPLSSRPWLVIYKLCDFRQAA